MQRGFEPALPHALCTLSRESTLAASLRRLLQNDSLLDTGSRRSLYLELIQLLRHLGEPHGDTPAFSLHFQLSKVCLSNEVKL